MNRYRVTGSNPFRTKRIRFDCEATSRADAVLQYAEHLLSINEYVPARSVRKLPANRAAGARCGEFTKVKKSYGHNIE